jgi:hypothetical protein
VQVVSSSVEVADFGATTTIGNTSTDHVEITNSSLKLKSGSFAHVAITPAGMQIGSVGNGITLDSAGSATFHGSITITGPQIASLTGSVHNAAVAAQDTADTATDIATAVANVTASLENETTFTPSTAAGTADGLHLGSDKLGFVQSSVWKTYMDNSGNFYLGGTSGALTWTAGTSTLDVNRITATTGTIGDFDIGTSTLESSNDKLILDGSADGKIRLGASPPPSATSGTGIFLGGDGTFLAGASAGNRIQFTGGSVVIQSNTFALNTNTIIIDSGVNSGKISLGASGGPTSNAAGQGKAGVYMDGTGDFFISDGGTSGATGTESYLKFDASGTPGASSFELKTPALTFEADGTITSQDYLIERSRLFGAGIDDDGTVTLGTSGTTHASDDDSAEYIDGNGSGTWALVRDAYMTNLTIDNGATLYTNGFRLYVKGTLQINATGKISVAGTAGTSNTGQSNPGQAGGAGGGNGKAITDVSSKCTLVEGATGGDGGAGGPALGTADNPGCGGGGAGGGGGILFVSAKTIINNANNGYGFVAHGGNGGAGGAGGSLLF